MEIYYVTESKLWKVHSPTRITDEVIERVRAAAFDIYIDGHFETNAMIICRDQSDGIAARTEDIVRCFS